MNEPKSGTRPDSVEGYPAPYSLATTVRSMANGVIC